MKTAEELRKMTSNELVAYQNELRNQIYEAQRQFEQRVANTLFLQQELERLRTK